MEDLQEFFYGRPCGYLPGFLQRLEAPARDMEAQAAYMRELRENANQALRDMEAITGVKLS